MWAVGRRALPHAQVSAGRAALRDVVRLRRGDAHAAAAPTARPQRRRHHHQPRAGCVVGRQRFDAPSTLVVPGGEPGTAYLGTSGQCAWRLGGGVRRPSCPR
eukprot:scaffold1542_cov402-Prasinococcus_capsulatus_cf.AAC.14